MGQGARSSFRLALRLIAGLALLGWPQTGSAAGTWSVVSYPQQSGDILHPTALAADVEGNLYVADWISIPNRLQERDAQGNWSLIAPQGTASDRFWLPPPSPWISRATSMSLIAAGSRSGMPEATGR